MKIIYLIIIALTFSITSCVSYKVSNFQTADELNEKIPNLELKIIEQNLETFYGTKVIRICKGSEEPDFFSGVGGLVDYNCFYENAPNGSSAALLNVAGPNPRLKETSPKSSNYYRIDDFYVGKNLDFQTVLLSNSETLALKELKDKSLKVDTNLIKEISSKSCPSFAPNAEFQFYPSTYERFGYRNYTLPTLIGDVMNIYEHEFNKNILRDSEVDGYIILKLMSDKMYNNSASAGTAFKTFLLFFTGVPIMRQEREIQIQIDIFSNKHNLVKSYSEKGFAKKYCAMYWGYSFFNAGVSNSKGQLARATNSAAFLDALLKIKKKINEDSNEISKLLISNE